MADEEKAWKSFLEKLARHRHLNEHGESVLDEEGWKLLEVERERTRLLDSEDVRARTRAARLFPLHPDRAG